MWPQLCQLDKKECSTWSAQPWLTLLSREQFSLNQKKWRATRFMWSSTQYIYFVIEIIMKTKIQRKHWTPSFCSYSFILDGIVNWHMLFDGDRSSYLLLNEFLLLYLQSTILTLLPFTKSTPLYFYFSMSLITVSFKNSPKIKFKKN